MQTDLIQALRYKLQKRVRRLNTVGYQHFHATLKQLWTFLHTQSVLVGVIEELLPSYPDLGPHVETQMTSREIITCDDEAENAAFAYAILKRCVESSDPLVEAMIGHNFTSGNHHDQALEAFRVAFMDPLYEYLDEHLDDQRAVLAILRRYKQKCESFQRKHLYTLWQADTTKGEENLAFHLYEYLHDQGIGVTIEPYSESGRVDMIAAQGTDDPLVADAKVFTPEKGIPYLCHGFHQVYQYTLDYNEPFGDLVVFKACPADLHFAVPCQEQSIPFLTHNHKTIFLLTIDIYPHDKPASKRGYLKTYEIAVDDLIRAASAGEDQ